jgi:hypothetical protein
MKNLLFIGLIILFSACTKEKISPTASDQITMQLQKIIKERGIERVYAMI